MIRAILITAAIASVFLFPYPATLILSFAASLAFPLAGVAVGALVDLLYATPHATVIPVGLMWGTIMSCSAFILRRFLRARVSFA